MNHFENLIKNSIKVWEPLKYLRFIFKKLIKYCKKNPNNYEKPSISLRKLFKISGIKIFPIQFFYYKISHLKHFKIAIFIEIKLLFYMNSFNLVSCLEQIQPKHKNYFPLFYPHLTVIHIHNVQKKKINFEIYLLMTFRDFFSFCKSRVL